MVETKIEDGQRYLSRLLEEDFKVAAACWAKPFEDDRWILYIATPLVDKQGLNNAYREALRILRTLPETTLSSAEITLVGEGHQIAKDLLKTRQEHKGVSVTRDQRTTLGGMSIERAFIYPVVTRYGAELKEEEERLLERLYSRTTLSVDELPYTQDMEKLHRDFVLETGLAYSIRDVFKTLLRLRKCGKLGVKAALQADPSPAPMPSSP